MAAERDGEIALIVGAGQAGGQVAHHLRAEGFAGRIVIVGAEPYLPYERPPLSKAVLKGAASEDSLFLCSDTDWQQDAVEILLGDPVVALDMMARCARLASGKEISFNHLVVATGGAARTLAVPGGELCHVLRGLDDSRTLRADLAASAARLAIIGGGVIGMEVAATAASGGAQVTVIEAGDRVMARILPPVVSTWLEDLHRQAGVNILTKASIAAIERTGEGLHITGPDLHIAADVVLAAIGIRPSVDLLPASVIGPTGGILTDACGRITGLTDCYAVGDVAECWNSLYDRPVRLETWRNADRGAKAVARTLCGTETPHEETPWMWTDQFDRNIQVVGLWEDGADVICRGDCGTRGSSVYWLKEGVLCGGVLIDNGRDRRFLEKLVTAQATPDPDRLADANVPLKALA